MDIALKEEIFRKCRKKFVSLEAFEESEEKTEYEKGLDKLDDSQEMLDDEQPLDDILAEKRRSYSHREEFIFLLYNDMLEHFISNWNGTFIRKTSKLNEENVQTDLEENDDFIEPKNEILDEESAASILSWKLIFPDEFANVQFINNNSYTGRISRKMMEGDGFYKWNNGIQYKGEFERNCIRGKGLFEWNNDFWYEGNFLHGFRHGNGTMVDRENRCMYVGQWYMSQKHGKGLCRYGDNGSYDGDWLMDKMDGFGTRIYESGSRYVGQWKNGLRHGSGTMIWSNGDVYSGEWRFGEINGYGEYKWNGFFNKTLSWPQEASYAGNWRHGMRHGEGELKLNLIGGAKYTGYWKDNKKFGYGTVIGNNGEKIEADPLFINDILFTSTLLEVGLENGKCTDENEFLEKPEELAESPVTPVMKPEQFPNFYYYISRLLSSEIIPALHSVPSGKYIPYKNRKSSSCLVDESIATTQSNEKNQFTSTSEGNKDSEDLATQWQYEECWIRNCLTVHMSCLRMIYDIYAKLFVAEAPNCPLIMARICLWQLWKDCRINEKHLTLTEIDKLIAKNESTHVEDPYNPFERIEIWQFLHALIEISWHLYTQYGDTESEKTNGNLAGGLQKFLDNDVYPNVKNHSGHLWHEYYNILPIDCVFQLYKQIEYPLSAKTCLRAFCTPNSLLTYSPLTSEKIPNGINSVTFGKKISYLQISTEALPRLGTIDAPKQDVGQSQGTKDLYTEFKTLGASKLVEIMIETCPTIKDADSGKIVNMDCELTFLEFYEIILAATKELVCVNKGVEKKKRTEIELDVPSNSRSQDIQTFRSRRFSVTYKNLKPRKRNFT